MKRFFILLFIIGTLTTNAQSHNKLSNEFDAFLQKEFSSNEPGGTVLIKKGDDTIFLKSYGLANMKTGEKNTENTIYNTGSISKTFVANGILILSERNLLSLDDTLFDHFPDFKNQEIAQQVTIKNLLSHTSGIPDLRPIRAQPDFYLTAKDTANFEPIKAVQTLNFEPGEKFQYSNPCYNGLALIIEKVSGQPWQEFIIKNIFAPSGMEHSTITNGPHPASGVAHAYVKNRNVYEESDYGEVPTFAAAGNGGVWSTVNDLAKYEKAHKNEIFLNKMSIKNSRTAYRPTNWKSDILPFVGYGWMMGERMLLRSEDYPNVYIVHHTGSQGGFRAFHISIPDQDIVFIGLFNRPVQSFRPLMKTGFDLLKEHGYLK